CSICRSGCERSGTSGCRAPKSVDCRQRIGSRGEEDVVRGRGRWVVKGAAFVALAVVSIAVLSFVVMSLWNSLIPTLFRGAQLEYWQAVGLLLLSRILFGGLRGRGGWHGHWRERMWREVWASPTPEQRKVPEPAVGELLIRVAAAGVNRADVLQRRGLYPPPAGASDIPGLEVAGVVVRLDPAVRGIAVGAPVCALLSGGGYAEYVAVPAVQCLPAPEPLTLEEAAALPEAFFTVWLNVFERARLREGETLLIHGGASGVG